jgi:biopolymer transport protein TolQ
LRALGILILALQDQEQGLTTALPETTGTSLSVVELVLNASPPVQLVMLVLLLFSAISWGIVLFKQQQYRRAEQQSLSFLDVFRKSNKFSEVKAVCGNLAASPLVGVFQAGYTELMTQLRDAEKRPADGSSRPILMSLDAVDRALLRATTTEIAKLEHRVSFLATTASITPYIGLFGTVWGIMVAFMGIAEAGSSSLGVVAPGIAEALIATALGLFAAIPAVYFYNDATSRVKAFANQMEDFSMEFLTISERNFT